VLQELFCNPKLLFVVQNMFELLPWLKIKVEKAFLCFKLLAGKKDPQILKDFFSPRQTKIKF